MFILLLVMATYGSDDDEHGFKSRTDYQKLKLILPIEDVSKEDIRKILVKKQWIILEYPLVYPLQRINYSKKDSFEMLSYLFDENKIRLSQLGYELSKLGEYEKDCYSLIFTDTLSEKNENTILLPSKSEIEKKMKDYQWDMLFNLVTTQPAKTIKIPQIHYDSIIPVYPINIERLKSIGYMLGSYYIGDTVFHKLCFIQNDEDVTK